ncbi:TonB-dependent siderophore receptor [Kerstersia similis]|uniref:TonB-dependent siderophore receptor n=1 Tax=Kerstersia similis TaxID=206505 RepID=UPI0039F08A47
MTAPFIPLTSLACPPPALLTLALAACLSVTHGVNAQTADTPAALLPAAEHAATLDAIVVTGAATDPRTEGSGSYTVHQTSAATRLPLSLRDTPQSVTVMTRQHLDDQQLTSVQAALEQTVGISSQTLDSERVSFHARGFAIDSFQYDGIPTAFLDGASFLDTAFYDRIEVVRGATGLLTGAGNPSASVNLVRKRPGRAFAATLSASAGSWDNYRGLADLSTPLAEEGRIRMRVVGAYQDRHSYIDLYQQKKQAFYGIIEADITDATLFSAGYDYQNITPTGTTWGGVPRWYSDGTLAEWRRSKTLAADWSHWDNRISTAFAKLEHQFGNDWNAQLSFNQQRSQAHAQLFSGLGFPDRATGTGLLPVALASTAQTRQNSVDAMVTGPFELLGQRHELTLGMMSSSRHADDNSTGFVFPATPISNFQDWNGQYPKPDFSAQPHTLTQTLTRQRGLYGVARFSLGTRVKLITGGRLNRYAIDQNASGKTFHNKETGRFTPYAGLVLDLDARHSAYASYTTIFNPQTNRDRDNQVLSPTRGKNAEIGLKSEFLDGRLNTAIALFDIRMDNVAQMDAGQMLPDGTQAYYAASGTQSRGFDLEIQGEPIRGWNLYAGVSHFTASDANGARLSTQLPRTTARLFSTWRLPAGWQALTLGAGLNWQSRFYQTATSPAGPVTTGQPSYALASVMARYAITPQLDVALNINNLFDKKYAVMSGFYNQVLYGEPRNAMLTLNYRP